MKTQLRGRSRASLLCAAASALFANAANAQDDARRPAPPAASEADIVVTGIRGSLDAALNLKQRASNIVDAISAEDIGKFPDSNVAESLAHITGVAITRGRGGEGQFVTVRGLSESFNVVTLNNRLLATDNAGREFSFDVLPADIISGSQVYKTPLPSLPEGSIGATVNISTARPFDRPGFRAALTAGGDYGDINRDLGPRISGAISNTFGEVFGALLAFSYTDRHLRTDNATTLDAEVADFDIDGDGSIGAGELGLYMPGTSYYGSYLERRRRLGVTGALQFRPTDGVDFTLDGLYSHYSTPAATSTLVHVLSGSVLAELAHLEPGSKVDGNGTITDFTLSDLRSEIAYLSENRVVDTYQLGANLSWDLGPGLKLGFDGSWSKATRPEGGQQAFVVAGIPHTTVSYHGVTGAVPGRQVTLADGRDISSTANDDYNIHYIGLSGDNRKDEIWSGRVTASYEPDAGLLKALRVGAEYTMRTKARAYFDNAAGECNFCDYPFGFGDVGVTVMGSPLARDLFGKEKTIFPRRFPSMDVAAYLRAAKGAENNPAIVDPHTGEPYPAGYSDALTPVLNPASSSYIREKTLAAFAQVDFTSGPLDGNIGARIVSTRVLSKGHSSELLSLTPTCATCLDAIPTFSPLLPVAGRSSYTQFLPSLNLRYEIEPRLILRAAAAKVLSRPSLTQLSTAVFIGTDVGDRTVFHEGNPALKPTTAWQGDLSLEWYFARSSALTFATFYKDIRGFASTVTREIQLAGYPFLDIGMVNGDGATVYGAEVSFQHFWNNGLGIQLNYTFADSRSKLDSVQAGLETTLEGLSKHSFNATGIYEKGPISTRLSFNYRGKYVQTALGRAERTEFVDPYKELDLSASYALTDNFSVTLEAVNLLDEGKYVYSQYRNRMLELNNTGRRFSFSVRTKW